MSNNTVVDMRNENNSDIPPVELARITRQGSYMRDRSSLGISGQNDGRALFNNATELYRDCKKKAKRLRNLNSIALFIVRAASLTHGIIGINNEDYMESVLGFVILGITELLSTYPIGDRSVVLKHLSTQLKHKRRDISRLINSNLPVKIKQQRLDVIDDQIDEIDNMIFDTNRTPDTRVYQQIDVGSGIIESDDN